MPDNATTTHLWKYFHEPTFGYKTHWVDDGSGYRPINPLNVSLGNHLILNAYRNTDELIKDLVIYQFIESFQEYFKEINSEKIFLLFVEQLNDLMLFSKVNFDYKNNSLTFCWNCFTRCKNCFSLLKENEYSTDNLCLRENCYSDYRRFLGRNINHLTGLEQKLADLFHQFQTITFSPEQTNVESFKNSLLNIRTYVEDLSNIFIRWLKDKEVIEVLKSPDYVLMKPIHKEFEPVDETSLKISFNTTYPKKANRPLEDAFLHNTKEEFNALFKSSNGFEQYCFLKRLTWLEQRKETGLPLDSKKLIDLVNNIVLAKSG